MQMTVLLAEGPMFQQALLTAVNEKGKPYGMEMNIIIMISLAVAGLIETYVRGIAW